VEPLSVEYAALVPLVEDTATNVGVVPPTLPYATEYQVEEEGKPVELAVQVEVPLPYATLLPVVCDIATNVLLP
jgi:hypothetical protein